MAPAKNITNQKRVEFTHKFSYQILLVINREWGRCVRSPKLPPTYNHLFHLLSDFLLYNTPVWCTQHNACVQKWLLLHYIARNHPHYNLTKQPQLAPCSSSSSAKSIRQIANRRPWEKPVIPPNRPADALPSSSKCGGKVRKSGRGSWTHGWETVCYSIPLLSDLWPLCTNNLFGKETIFVYYCSVQHEQFEQLELVQTSADLHPFPHISIHCHLSWWLD